MFGRLYCLVIGHNLQSHFAVNVGRHVIQIQFLHFFILFLFRFCLMANVCLNRVQSQKRNKMKMNKSIQPGDVGTRTPCYAFPKDFGRTWIEIYNFKCTTWSAYHHILVFFCGVKYFQTLTQLWEIVPHVIISPWEPHSLKPIKMIIDHRLFFALILHSPH